jgi:hypothetical protein
MPNERSDFQAPFNRFARSNGGRRAMADTFGDNAAFELKVMRGPSFPLDALERHQRLALIETYKRGHYVRMEDEGTVSNAKPYDCLTVKGNAYVVVWPYVRGQRTEKRTAYFIHIADWLKIEDECVELGRKSATLEMIQRYGKSLNVWIK